MKRSAPLKRSGFKRKPDAPFSSFGARKAPIRRRRKYVSVAESSRYLAACRGEPCYLRVRGVCRLNPLDETVVPCHDNSLEAGKGMGLKARHDRTVPGCMRCHAWLDQGPAAREVKRGVFSEAFARWQPVRDLKMGVA
ncbi:nuclease domain-containing protein [Paraburkholderia kururiensis]|uniref:nuclease domain-containing protein n=1 Tax=Paraburkholderia kururiensis TaxID=984307 RepID=UPI000373EC12|nr:nuclease domain-containing protein [Paraburkholderia kururiensis]